MSSAPGPLPADVRRYLASARLGRRIYFYPETDSTNDVAMGLARAGEEEGAVVVAGFQRSGRGRRSHEWSSPPDRDVLASLVLRPRVDARTALAITLTFATASAVALSKILGVEMGVKWPNDVVVRSADGRHGKLAGILAESASAGDSLAWLVIGFGINVNTRETEFPLEVRAHAVSCFTLTGVEWDRAFVLADVIGVFEAYYDRFRRDGFAPLVSACDGRLLQRGREVWFERDGQRVSGRALGVAPDGALRVRLHRDNEEALLYSETVEMVA